MKQHVYYIQSKHELFIKLLTQDAEQHCQKKYGENLSRLENIAMAERLSAIVANR